MQVKKQTFPDWQTAMVLVTAKLAEGKGSVRIITSRSKLAARYGIFGDQVQVRYW